MTSFFRKYQNIILIVIILSFLSGVGYVGYGAFNAGAADRGTVAVVGGEKISAASLNRLVKDMEMRERSKGVDVQDSETEAMKQQALQGLLYESALVQGAKSYGMYVPDFELAYTIRTNPLFNTGGGFDKKIYVWTVRNQLGLNPADFEDLQRRLILMNSASHLLASAYRVTPEELKYNFKTQYGGMKDFDAKKAAFLPTL